MNRDESDAARRQAATHAHALRERERDDIEPIHTVGDIELRRFGRVYWIAGQAMHARLDVRAWTPEMLAAVLVDALGRTFDEATDPRERHRAGEAHGMASELLEELMHAEKLRAEGENG